MQLKTGRGKSLTDYEKGQISALHGQLVSTRKISEGVNRPRGALESFLKRHKRGGHKISLDRRHKISATQIGAVFREANKGNETATSLKSISNLPFGVLRV